MHCPVILPLPRGTAQSLFQCHNALPAQSSTVTIYCQLSLPLSGCTAVPPNGIITITTIITHIPPSPIRLRLASRLHYNHHYRQYYHRTHPHSSTTTTITTTTINITIRITLPPP
ncbi:hypothetical protein PoB_000452700 [Plakobranchus ocellatus]|uniref:Uncharacterized protein n=1 Tax=Plakobranchus ocellatus TaxID=259542 RepID=A0AAV3Y7D8_9GAST|nr:hypothetical protein PoB_000452700 [Plakobranchus ocellatus]